MALASPVVGALCLAFWSENLAGLFQGVTSDFPVACGPECPEPACNLLCAFASVGWKADMLFS